MGERIQVASSAYRSWPSLVVSVAFALLLVALTVLMRQYAADAEAAADAVAHTYAVLADLNATEARLIDAETGQRGFLITGDEQYLQPYRMAIGDIEARLRDLTTLTADNPDQQRDITLLRAFAREKLDELDQTIAVRRRDGFAAAQRIVETNQGKTAMDRLRDVTSRMGAREQALLDVRKAQARRGSEAARLVTFVSTGIAVAAVALVWFGYRRFGRERFRAAEAVAAARERLEVTLLSIGDGVIVVDEAGCVTLMNRVAETLTGWPVSTGVGRPVAAVFHIVYEHTRETVPNPLSAVLETGAVQGLANHVVLIAADGTERPIDDSAAPLCDAEGRVLGAVLVFRDVSQRRASEQRVQAALDEARSSRAVAEQRQRELESALEVKNEFLAAVSHELRTPINTIVGWARMLHQRTVRPEKIDAAIASIDGSARTLAQLIDDLLESSRLLTGKLRLASEPIDIASVVTEAVDMMALAAENKGVSIEVDAKPVPPIRGDGDRLKQVLWNVLGNAVKFTPAGGRVRLRVAHTIDAVEIAISDTGAGIAPDFLPHVFDRFRQGDETARTGLGLGLAIAKQLVELHGGTIEASSDGVDRGATFTIRLPPVPAGVAVVGTLT